MIFDSSLLYGNILLFVYCIFGYYFIAIISFILQISLVLLYLDYFRFSPSVLIRYFQILSIVLLFLCIIVFLYSDMSYINHISCIKDENDIHLHGHVSMDKQAAEVLGKSLSTVGSNLGLAGCVGAGTYGVSRTIARSSLPPVAKAGLVLVGGAAGTLYYTVGTAVSIKTSRANFSGHTVDQNIIPKSGNSLISFMDDNTPLEILLQCVYLFNLLSLYVFIIICLQLFYRYYVSDKPKLLWLNYIFSISKADLIRTYIYKLIKLNKNMNIFWIIFAVVLLAVCISGSIYAAWELYSDIDGYVADYIKYKTNK